MVRRCGTIFGVGGFAVAGSKEAADSLATMADSLAGAAASVRTVCDNLLAARRVRLALPSFPPESD